MGLLSDLYPEIRQQLLIDERKRQYVHDPARWAWDMLEVQLWSKQREIAMAVKANRRVAVAAGHGVGKSFVAGVICLWWWDTHPQMEDETFIATTAPSKAQVDLIWSTIRVFHSRMRLRFENELIDHCLPGYITGDNKYKLPDGQMLGQGRKPPDSRSDIAFQGRHATYLLAIGDEAVGLTEGFLNALEVIAVGEKNCILLLANPTDPSCAMARIWPDPEGRGGRAGWKRIHISVLESPLITGEEGFDSSRVSGMSGTEFLEGAEIMYGGKDDPRYIARVLGEWAWDNGVGLFPEEIISRSMRTIVVPDADDSNPRFGVDVSRMGIDSTQVYMTEEGWVWETEFDGDEEKLVKTETRGLRIRWVDSWTKAPVSSKNPEKLGTANRIDRLALEYGIPAVNIDAGGGLGGGLFDAIEDIWYEDQRQQSYAMFLVDGSAIRDVDRRAYINLRAFGFGDLKRRMAAGEVDLDEDDFDLLEEIRGIRAKVVNGSALQIEKKEDMKNRGAKSPDRADAVWYSTIDSLGVAASIQAGQQYQLDPEDWVDPEMEWYRSSNYGW